MQIFTYIDSGYLWSPVLKVAPEEGHSDAEKKDCSRLDKECDPVHRDPTLLLPCWSLVPGCLSHANNATWTTGCKWRETCIKWQIWHSAVQSDGYPIRKWIVPAIHNLLCTRYTENDYLLCYFGCLRETSVRVTPMDILTDDDPGTWLTKWLNRPQTLTVSQIFCECTTTDYL